MTATDRALDVCEPDPSDFLCECGAEPDGGTPSAPTYSACTCGAEADAERGPFVVHPTWPGAVAA